MSDFVPNKMRVDGVWGNLDARMKSRKSAGKKAKRSRWECPKCFQIMKMQDARWHKERGCAYKPKTK
jgi:hypothetical protein